MKVILSGLLLIVVCAGITPVATAQVAPVCRETAADADGDGFGWQDSESCIITQASEPAPVITNLETNEYVKLTRAYWNAPVDLYNKTITCINNIYQTKTGTYVPDNDPGRETHYSFHYTHLPLTATAPYTGTVKSEHIVTAGPRSDYYYSESFESWSMDNGIYAGAAPFTESPYVETITVPSTDEIAIRTWRGSSSFVQCSVSPTGIPPGLEEDNSEQINSTESGASDEATDSNADDENVTAPAGSNVENNDNVNHTGNSSGDDTDSAVATINQDSNSEADNNTTAAEIDSTSSSSEPLVSNDTSTQTNELSNPFATASGGGSVGIWLIALLVLFRRSPRH